MRDEAGLAAWVIGNRMQALEGEVLGWCKTGRIWKRTG